MLTRLYSGLGLGVPTAISTTVTLTYTGTIAPEEIDLDNRALLMSRISSMFLMVAYSTYIYFQVRSRHNIYDAILLNDEKNDEDRYIRILQKTNPLLPNALLSGLYFLLPSHFLPSS
jgi:hypothetical protein